MKGFLVGHPTLRLTSNFGKRLMNGKVSNHNGIDIGIPSGTVIKAPLSGKIIQRRVQKKGAGLYVTIRHTIDSSNYIDILLMHLHSTEPYITIGFTIQEGQTIGTTGGAPGDQPNAGRSTGPHLHLEIRKGGLAIHPLYNFLAKETIVEAKTGRIIQQGNSNITSFSDSLFKTQTGYKYSAKADVTVKNETEYVPKVPPKPAVSTGNTTNERYAPGIWRITKVLIDSSVADKQVMDSGISTLQGSLLNFFRKVCQEPMVEFMGDTFGNQYYWIVRRPPTDKEGMTKMIDLTTIDLNSDDIESTDLNWNNQGIYSWYQFVPYADMLGMREATFFNPAIFFPEFASVWGSKPLSVESNYYNFAFSGRWNADKTDNEANGNRIIKNALLDFKYLIESNAYNAFTRRGTITLRNGDRRIKRGTLILHTSGEVFYVDSVSNSFEVSTGGASRTTTLSVSRGMYPAYIYGKEIGGKIMSYFNIIDFGNFDINSVDSANWREVISKWKVNVDSFGFFMSKQQVFWENINK